MLTPYGKSQWMAILCIAAGLVAASGILAMTLDPRWWLGAPAAVIVALALLSFFRDPNRRIPSDKDVFVSPSDGRVSSVHRVEHFAPFDGPALCVRIFMSVLNVHVNRSPCHGTVAAVSHRPGRYLNALNPESAEVNEARLMVLVHPTRRTPIAAVRQVAGTIARRIVCDAEEGRTLQRGERFGMIKFGSTTELYLPESAQPEARVVIGQRVSGGATILAAAITTHTEEPHEQVDHAVV